MLNFPIPGANSRLLGESDALAIEVNNVSKEDLDVSQLMYRKTK
jgi:hypothetical protein